MSHVKRFICLMLLFGLWTSVAVLMNPEGDFATDDEVVTRYWPRLWLGLYAVPACLLGVWGSMGRQPLTAVTLTAVIGFLATWGRIPGRTANIENLLVGLSLTCLGALFLGLLMHRSGWVIEIDGCNGTTSRRRQYTTLRLLRWTSVAAFVFAVANVVSAGEIDAAEWFVGGLRGLVLAAFFVPLTFPAVGLVLVKGRRVGFGIWLTVMMLVAWRGAVHLSGLYPDFTRAIIFDTVNINVTLPQAVTLLFCGYFTLLTTSLLILRCGGFRVAAQSV